MSGFAVEIKNLRKSFKQHLNRKALLAVDGVSLRIAHGEVYGLVGPNGSGKSTIMKALLGLLTPDSGSSAVFGRDSLKVDSRAEVGFLPENPYFYKHLSGAETLRFYGKLSGLKGKLLEQRMKELLELTGLSDAASRRVGVYSKGMLQRIGLAQALIQDPDLLVLDEPTAGVDPAGSRVIRNLIIELRDRGKTIFLCSHLLEQVQEVCDRVGIIHRGKLVREGRLDELLAIEDQTELVLRNASAELQQRLETLVRHDGRAELVRMGKAQTTLECLFMKETGEGEK